MKNVLRKPFLCFLAQIWRVFNTSKELRDFWADLRLVPNVCTPGLRPLLSHFTLPFVCVPVAVVWLVSTPTLACQRSEWTMDYPGTGGCFNNCGKWGMYRCMIQAPTSKVLNWNPTEMRSNTIEHNATFCMAAQCYYKSAGAVFGKVTLLGNRCLLSCGIYVQWAMG